MRVTPGFLVAEEIAGDVDVGQLIVEFSGNAEAIVAIVDVERVIKDAPCRNRLYLSCKKVW
jgi:hypothetical protein